MTYIYDIDNDILNGISIEELRGNLQNLGENQISSLKKIQMKLIMVLQEQKTKIKNFI